MGGGEGSNFSVTTSGSLYDVEFKVTYTYEAAPVPEAASLGVLSLGAMALLARRRK